ncbi:hypothetical protein Sjap_002151 [Stephania japonica]|uniref:Uncharacterized protein n=1 Tax=Stephania japonica TaxID=461633 RepID=A0AAP0KLA8_9MAGN
MARKKSLTTQEETSVGNSKRGEEVASRGRTTQTTSHRKRKAMDQLVVKRAQKVRVEEVEEDHSHVDEGAKDVESDVEIGESSGNGETSKEDHDGDGDHSESSSSESRGEASEEEEGGGDGDNDSEEDGDDDGDDANEYSDDVGDSDDDRESAGKGDGNDDHDSEKIDKTDHGKRVIAKTVSVSAKSSEPVRGKKVSGKTVSAKTISAMVASNKKNVAKKGCGKKKAATENIVHNKSPPLLVDVDVDPIVMKPSPHALAPTATYVSHNG